MYIFNSDTLALIFFLRHKVRKITLAHAQYERFDEAIVS